MWKMSVENFICTDNFFKKMTDLDSPKKNNDCYFYYYSTCAKGDNCTFRHEPSALGCETMCSFWKEGKCLNVHCNFRHMELRKNRKAIPCYWESQPGGCLKPHCPFMHQNPKPNEVSVKSDKAENRLNETYNQTSDTYKNASAVDSLVVNFEEESDNESAPTTSPVKQGVNSTNTRAVKVKTLEEIKLEKIQAASAAYYSYSNDEEMPLSQTSSTDSDDLRQRIISRIKNNKPKNPSNTAYQVAVTESETKAATKRKLSNDEIADILGDDSLRQGKLSEKQIYTILNDENTKYKKQKLESTAEDMTRTDFKIKTLQEIRAERNKNEEKQADDKIKIGEKRKLTLTKPVRLTRPKIAKLNTKTKNDDETEVSSTSNDEQIVSEIVTTDAQISPKNNNPSSEILTKNNNPSSEILVTKNPTSIESGEYNKKPAPLRRLNLKKRIKTQKITEENIINSSNLEESPLDTDKNAQTLGITSSEQRSREERIGNVTDNDLLQIESEALQNQVITQERNIDTRKEDKPSEGDTAFTQILDNETKCKNEEPINSLSSVSSADVSGSKQTELLGLSECHSKKDVIVDETMLLLDDEDEHLENNVTLKAEEDLLNEIDDFLDD